MLFINNYYYFINWNFARLHMKNDIQIQFTINFFFNLDDIFPSFKMYSIKLSINSKNMFYYRMTSV